MISSKKIQNCSEASSLLLVNLDHVVLLHLQSFGGFVIVDPSSVKQKPERGDGDAHPLGIGLLQFTHLSCLLHSEVDFIAVLPNNLQLDVLRVFSHGLASQEAGSLSPLKMATSSAVVVTDRMAPIGLDARKGRP